MVPGGLLVPSLGELVEVTGDAVLDSGRGELRLDAVVNRGLVGCDMSTYGASRYDFLPVTALSRYIRLQY